MADKDDAQFPPHPRTAATLVGHADAERILLEAWNSGRLPHAWLICGPPGIGKATLAYRFARFVLAGGGDGGLFGGPETLALDPSHPVFRRVAAGAHADLMSVERPFTDEEMKKEPEDRRRRKESIGVDEVRAAVHFLKLTPAEGGWRVVIVDSADELTPNAANALLKSLEEPSYKSLILLISHAPYSLLPTIRSRTSRLNLRSLSNNDMETLVFHYLPDLPLSDRAALVAISDGSIGRALALGAKGGLELDREVSAMLSALPKTDPERLHRLADSLARAGQEEAWRTATGLLSWRLARAIEAAAHGRPTELTPLVRRLDRAVEVWDKVRQLVAQSDGTPHARKQVVLGAFFALERAARG
jgi:DNA polymerase-3 subunit delta'